MINRRHFGFASAALASAAFGLMIAAPAHAQNFPTKPVTLIVPWPAGGSSDLALRAFAEAAQKHLGQPIIIENRPGASGTLGPAQMAATAKPDGYTIAQMPITVFRLPYMTKTTFDPTKDFTYIAGLTGYTFGVVVQSKIAVEDVQGVHRLRQGQPRQDQVRHARHRHQPAHRHGADRQADRRHEVDAGAVQGRAPRPTRRCSAVTSMPSRIRRAGARW